MQAAQDTFGGLIAEELKRVENMREPRMPIDFKTLDKVIIGILPGDGIGPIIMKQAFRVLEYMMKEELASGRVEIRHIDGMTIENRAALNESLPEGILEEIKQCHVFLKGPMVTPRPGEHWPDLVSANSILRRHLDLFAAVRPIRISEKGIDWTFFRENIEGEYANPCSLIRAAGMLASHIGYGERKLDEALDICTVTDRKVVVTTFKEDASAEKFTDYLLETLAAI